jgi:hypothetical protein
MPTYGYRRVHAILRRKARNEDRPWPNAKRVYRVMKVHGMLLQRHTGAIDTRRHDGRVAVSNPICVGVQTGSKSAVKTKRRSALPSLSIAVIVNCPPFRLRISD